MKPVTSLVILAMLLAVILPCASAVAATMLREIHLSESCDTTLNGTANCYGSIQALENAAARIMLDNLENTACAISHWDRHLVDVTVSFTLTPVLVTPTGDLLPATFTSIWGDNLNTLQSDFQECPYRISVVSFWDYSAMIAGVMEQATFPPQSIFIRKYGGDYKRGVPAALPPTHRAGVKRGMRLTEA